MYALMMHDLVPESVREHVMADFERRTLSTVSQSPVAWFHYSQAVLKRENKLGVGEDYQNRDDNFLNFYCLVTNVTVLLQLGFLFIFNRNLWFSCV